MINFDDRLAQFSTRFTEDLSQALQGEGRLLEAMRYSVMNGGKRLRPFLVIESAKLFGISYEKALNTAIALELIHCYSLIHDDLPAMDNDDMRRGKPTLHKAYDEATAILAGDALLTLAFEIIAKCEFSPKTTLTLIKLLGHASGKNGMVEGQMLDLAAEGRFSKANPLTDYQIRHLQALKTGALLHFACISGAVMAKKSYKNLSVFGQKIGLAFQIADDILDFTGDEQIVGKKLNKDAGLNKGTLVSLHGLEKAQIELETVTSEAIKALKKYNNTEMLKQTALFIANRDK